MIRLLAALLLVPVLASAQEAFQLPSGNIHCMAWEGTLRCDILQFAYKRPPRPAGCGEEYGDSVELAAGGPATLVCHGDTVADPASPVLPYGATWRGGGVTCTATQVGLRCVNRDGRGFDMARAGLRRF